MLPITKFSSYDKLSLEVAQHIFEKIQKHIIATGNFNLGLATGKSPKRLYKNLIRLLSAPHLDLSHLHTVNLDEYYPISQTDKHSFFQEMLRCFWQPLHDVNPSFDLTNCHILNGENDAETECEHYEKLIKDLGGIDLQILGLGPNGHIGFNEPGSEKGSRTRKIALTNSSKDALRNTFDTSESIPNFGLTMGIGTILEAGKIILITTGESKREIFHKLMKLEKPTKDIPASFLFDHPNTTVFTDLMFYP